MPRTFERGDPEPKMPNLEYAGGKRPRVPLGDLVLRTAAGLAVAVCLVELIVPAIFSQKSLHLATSVQSEPVTELYFVNHMTLPQHITAGKNTAVVFHIQNSQGADMIYYPRVTLFENGVGHVIALPQRALPIANGGGQDISVPVSPSQSGENLELVIDLPGQGESIHFRSQS
jgi:hypothetical protein